mmetsp:Transcript_40348/g.64821  ORF Transcript_40348/g.64821 Transcript_40348/m.64821 type:complete len:90 (+) Transcript_40348:375-644(+)
MENERSERIHGVPPIIDLGESIMAFPTAPRDGGEHFLAFAADHYCFIAIATTPLYATFAVFSIPEFVFVVRRCAERAIFPEVNVQQWKQ